MKKEAYYFSHDSNARNDPKILKLRVKHGMRGYGIFWAIIEMLRDQSDYMLTADYDSIAFSLADDSAIVASVICDFGLFEFSGDSFYSQSLNKRMAIKEEKSFKAKKAANKRWEKERNADAMQTHSDSNAHPMQGKERKGKEIKIINEQPVNDEKQLTYSEEEKDIIENKVFISIVNDRRWIEALCRNYKSEPDLIKEHLRKFYFHCKSYDYFKGKESDAKVHFNNWINKGNYPPKRTEVTLADNPPESY